MSEQQQHLFCKGAIDWQAGIDCKAKQLGDVMTKAERAGFKPIRVRVVGERYRVQFEQAKGISK